tara:strand:+ start:1117 stop:1650 length:534 start_codon:yes stop_codon:yes gene_type:complete
MKLTDGEKIIIAMLADIQKKVGGGEDTNTDFIMEAISGGHLWSLKWDMPGLLHDHEDDEDVVKETCDILDMWGFIELSFKDLPEDEKATIRADNYNHDPQFFGFDGNHEPHFGVAQHLIETMGRFSDFKGRYLNSHSARVESYREMFERFRPIRDRMGARGMPRLTADEIRAILNGR